MIVLPEDLGSAPGGSQIVAWYHGSRQTEARLGLTVMQSAVDELNFAITGAERVVTLTEEAVEARDLGYIDFLMPGVIGMAIMQLGLFSVAFSFVTMKREGVLRRLLATPLDPTSLLVAQVITRLIVVVIQTVILAAVAVFLFGAEFAGNFFAVLLAAAHGRRGVPGDGVRRVRLGPHGATGRAAGQHRVAAHDVFVRCVLFPGRSPRISCSGSPIFCRLTYLVEAIRGMTVEGDTVLMQWPNFLGLAVWLVVAFIIANRTFRWE